MHQVGARLTGGSIRRAAVQARPHPRLGSALPARDRLYQLYQKNTEIVEKEAVDYVLPVLTLREKRSSSSMVIVSELVRRQGEWSFRSEASFGTAAIRAEKERIARSLLASFIPTLRAEDELAIATVHDISSAITPKTVATLKSEFSANGLTMDVFVTAMVKALCKANSTLRQERQLVHLVGLLQVSLGLDRVPRRPLR